MFANEKFAFVNIDGVSVFIFILGFGFDNFLVFDVIYSTAGDIAALSDNKIPK